MAVQPKLSILADACLLKLYKFRQEGRSAVSTKVLVESFNGKVTQPVIIFAIEELELQKNASTYTNFETFGGDRTITRVGYKAVEKELDSSKSFLSIYSKKGDDWLFETGGIIGDEAVVAASNSETEDAWEPLQLDRQNPALAQAIEKLDELIQAIKQDNGYAANEPDERNFIVSALQTGVQALRDQTVIYRMQFRAFIWEPIKRITTRFGSSAIGVLADAAKESLKEWLKSTAKNVWSQL